MALANTIEGSQILIKVGDGGDPETFSHPCLINSARGLVLTAGTTERAVPDCSDPQLLQWIKRKKNSLSGSINGAGVLHGPNYKDYFNWLKSKDDKNIEICLDVLAAEGGGKVYGAFHLTTLELNGDNEGFAEVSIQLDSNGELDWTDAVA